MVDLQLLASRLEQQLQGHEIGSKELVEAAIRNARERRPNGITVSLQQEIRESKSPRKEFHWAALYLVEATIMALNLDAAEKQIPSVAARIQLQRNNYAMAEGKFNDRMQQIDRFYATGQ